MVLPKWPILFNLYTICKQHEKKNNNIIFSQIHLFIIIVVSISSIYVTKWCCQVLNFVKLQITSSQISSGHLL